MVFVDESLPDCIQLGAESDPMWLTNVVTAIGGFEATNQNWADARHTFDISYAVRDASDYMLIRVHFHMMRGRAKKFPFKDFLDFEVAASEGVLTDTESSPAIEYQFYKRYGSGSDLYDRKITRPTSGTIAVFRTRASVTTNITGSATISYTTGLVSISGHQAGDTYTWSGEFRVPVRYDTDKLPGIARDRSGGGGELLVECPAIMIVEVKE